jgi:Flp pilus assembly protein TadD
MISQTAACPPSTERDLISAIAQLDMGQVSAAKGSFTNLSSSAPQEISAIAEAYLALIAILENDQAAADRAVTAAREAAPTSLVSRYISSVVYQSAGELERALAQCLLPEESELMRLRCAELMLMNNEADLASELLSSSAAASAFEAEHAVLAGFIALQERDFGSAHSRFTEAATIDPSIARAHFGLGLATIGKGELDQALPHFLAAVNLEPQSAVYRSYLGKLYFELGAEPRALEEFAGALLIDPQDPTPLLYRSFVELSQNQPIAALRSLEESIDRNRNRVVFRSSALLDQDRAVRSASIGRIFSELGLQGPARTEALRSISSDYLNYSAHQLLADANDSLNELDASISERRIASLLAPLSLNALANTGGRSSFGEYSAMFDRAQTQSSWGLTWDGRDDIAALEALIAALDGPLGTSLRYQGSMRDGSTGQNYGRSHRIFGSADYELRPGSRIRLSLDGAFDDSSDSAQSIEDSEFRAGAAELSYTESLSNSSYWLSSVRYVREDSDLLALTESSGILEGLFSEDPTDLETLFLLNQDTDETLDRVQASSQFISTLGLSPLGQAQLVFGFQLNSIDADRDEQSEILDDSSGLFAFAPWRLSSAATNELQSADGYAYANLRPWHWLTATLGATATSLEFERRPIAPYIEETSRESHVSPKAGLLLTPLESLLIRASYFETLAKSTFEDQSSLEPTIVGGFSQRFNDFAGTHARALAFGVDYKVPGSTYLGIEWIGRKLKEESSLAFPVLEFDFDEPSVTDVIGVQDNDTFSTQDLVRAYAAQLLGSSWVIGSEWQWSELRYTDPLAFESQQTSRVSGTVRYFDPTGLFALGRVSWRNQDLLGNAVFADGAEDFTLVDIAFGYRLPRRQGKLSLEFINIGDTQFNYDQVFGFEPFIAPHFSVVGRVELRF